jgi:HTH-type transcriptional regulator / antitoxin PezA
MNNFISENIAFLIKKNDLALDDFGNMFDLSRGLTGQYVRKLALPKIITIQKICAYYNLTIDDFINTDLSVPKPYAIKQGQLLYTNEENINPYGISPRYLESLEKTIQDKEKIISMLEEKLQKEIPNETVRDGNKIIDEIAMVPEKKLVK